MTTTMDGHTSPRTIAPTAEMLNHIEFLKINATKSPAIFNQPQGRNIDMRIPKGRRQTVVDRKVHTDQSQCCEDGSVSDKYPTVAIFATTTRTILDITQARNILCLD